MDHPLSQTDIKMLREKGIITEQEVAVQTGDLIIAEHVISKARRQINVSGLMLESNRRLLTD